MSLLRKFDHNTMLEDNKYSKSIATPQYIIKGDSPAVQSLCDITKYMELLNNIEKSNVTPEEKKFLKRAAARHYTFNYTNIAEYYANASKEMQELMEQSALVIIDFDDAIKNGYVKMSKKIDELISISREKNNHGNEE